MVGNAIDQSDFPSKAIVLHGDELNSISSSWIRHAKGNQFIVYRTHNVYKHRPRDLYNEVS